MDNLVIKSKKKILVADDEPDMVDLVKARLEASGYQVITAQDGKAAYEMAKKEMPDLLVLDVMMPLINGFSLCAMLKRHAWFAKTPVILLTAKWGENDKKLGEEAMADAYLTKPFEPEILLNTIKKLLP